jgi:glycogen debranching enzyme
MKNTVRLPGLLLLFWMFTSSITAQTGYVPAFALDSNDLELTRMAQPGTYFDKVGHKFAVLGFESGSFEAWAYPLKLFRNCELSFLIGSSTEPIKARDIVRFISVTPEATTLTYTYQSFTIKAIYVTPVNEPGAFIFLEVNTTEPLTNVCRFLPVLQPMWPAGIGGQAASWQDDIKAYQISEPTRMNTGYIGSPAARGISYTPAHMLSDVPNQFEIEITDIQAPRGKYIPIIMAGGKGPRAETRKIYQRLAHDPASYYRANADYYRALRQNTMQVRTPHQRLNQAFEWAKVAYDNLVVDNPDLGRGLVAGLGSSGTGGRPGFGWFFGGDAFINSFSLDCYGALGTVKEALAFTQKWQREDGKMAHELSQSAGYLNWFKDYPYGYIHGDTSPFFVVAMAEYLRASGDVEFIKKSWESIRKAYEWSLSTDEDGDGLMDNQKAGLGALEYGALTDVQSDIYTGAVWVKATESMEFLAQAAGQEAYATKSRRDYQKALAALRSKFWDEKMQQYSYAFNLKGDHVDIVSPWSSVGLMWGFGEPERSLRSLEKLNSAELATDWGTRSLSIKNPLFEPLNYNYGAVWPFLTSWVGAAQYRHHLALQGYASLMASVNHTFDNALGFVTEVFSGYQNIPPQEGVPHQGFCTAGVVLPFVRGMLGLDGSALGKSITFAPQLPADWDAVEITGYRLADAQFSFSFRRTDKSIVIVARGSAPQPYQLRIAPALGIGSKILRVTVNGRETPFSEERSVQTIQPVLQVALAGELRCEITLVPVPEIIPPEPVTKAGDSNQGLKLISTQWSEPILRVVTEGLAGRSYRLRLRNAGLVSSVEGARQDGDALVIQFPPGAPDEFLRKEVAIKMLP